MVSVTGLLGAVLLPVVWLFHTYRSYETGGVEAADPRIPFLYAAASLLLLHHALQAGDLPLVVLGASMLLFTSTELVLLIRVKKWKKQ